MTEIRVYSNTNRLAQAAADHFANLAGRALEKAGRFSVVLAGGSTPSATYRLLAGEHYRSLDWQRIYLFWSDERCVHPNHPDSNYRMVCESLIEHVLIPPDHIFRMKCELSPEVAAMEYQRVLEDFFPEFDREGKSFDLVLLGMGTDGHTASLFPGCAALEEQERWVAVVPHEQPPPPLVTRLSLTLPIINAADQVTFLVSGANKAQRIRQALEPSAEVREPLPVQRVRPRIGKLLWLVDQEAKGQ